MQGRQALRELPQGVAQPAPAVAGDAPRAAADILQEVDALDPRHDEEGPAGVVLKAPVKRHEVRVVQPLQGARLRVEAPQLRPASLFRPLQRDDSPVLQILRPVYVPHAPFRGPSKIT